MKPFRATFTPIKEVGKPEGIYYGDDKDNARLVLVIAILLETEAGESTIPLVIFVDADNSLQSGYLDRFTDCQMDWRRE